MPQGDYTGDDFDLAHTQRRSSKAQLLRSKYVPGHKGFFWTIADQFGTKNIVIINPEHSYSKEYNDRTDKYEAEVGPAIIAQLGLDHKLNIPGINGYQIGAVAVRKEYRGQGFGTALYLLAMQQLKLWLMAGDSQTPGGRRNWITLNTIPGVEVDGLLMVPKEELDNPYRWGSDPDAVRRFDRIVNSLMEIGFNHIGNNHDYDFFLFPIKQGKGELMTAVKKAKFRIYHGWNGSSNNWDIDVSLVARWTGK
jgi:GNAT superfamily N-acetyltransferase